MIGGGARLSHLSGTPPLGTKPSEVEDLPNLAFLDEGTGTLIDLGPVQAVTLKMATLVKWPSAYTSEQPEPLFLGQAQAVRGQAAAPVQRQWRLGWSSGPRTSEDWPLIGSLPGITDKDLGAFLALDGLQGAWVRPLPGYNAVSVGG